MDFRWFSARKTWNLGRNYCTKCECNSMETDNRISHISIIDVKRPVGVDTTELCSAKVWVPDEVNLRRRPFSIEPRRKGRPGWPQRRREDHARPHGGGRRSS